MADLEPAASELVPDLEVVPIGTNERLLPEAADGEVEVWAGNDGFEAYGYAAGGHYWAHLPGIASFRFHAKRSAVVAFPDPRVPVKFVEDAFRRNVLPLVVQLRGHEVLHASAISTSDGVVGLCGATGTGKSTLAYGLAQRGCTLWADDAVVLDIGEDGATALQVPFRVSLRADATIFFGREPTPVMNGARLRDRLRALLVLEPLDAAAVRSADIDRLEPPAAFVSLLPHAYYFRLSDSARTALMLDRYLRLASQLPIYEVRYRPDLGTLAAVLDEIDDVLA